MRLGFGMGVGVGDGTLNGLVIARARPGEDYASLGGVASFTRADPSTCASYRTSAGRLALAAANVLRDAHYVGNVRTILLEPTRQNVAKPSAALSAWTPNNATVADDQTAAPDGNVTADWIKETVANAAHSVYQTFATAGTYITYTFLKSNQRTWGFITEGNSVTAKVYFDTGTGVVGQVSGSGSPTGVIVPFADGWYLCAMIFTAGANANAQFGPALGNGQSNYAGDITKGIFAWGAGFELGSYLTMPIPTVAAAVTRAVDALSFAGVAGSGLATLFYRYWDLATLAWVNLAAAYTYGTAITPAVGRAYADFVVLRGTLTTAEAAAVLGY